MSEVCPLCGGTHLLTTYTVPAGYECKGCKHRWTGSAAIPTWRVGSKVSKIGGDYRFDGVVVSIFQKVSGAPRIVVEDDRGVLFIARMDQYAVNP